MRTLTTLAIAGLLALTACSSSDNDDPLASCEAAITSGDVITDADVANCDKGGVTMTWNCQPDETASVTKIVIDGQGWAYSPGKPAARQGDDSTLDDLYEVCP